MTLNPLTVLIHDELLVLFSSRGYRTSPDIDVPNAGAEDDSHVQPELAHLTNGLLNQALNPKFDAEKHVWKGDQFRKALAESGVDYYKDIHPQVREIVATSMAATLPRMQMETNEVFLSNSRGAFGYWRHDFLLDESLKIWLLEVEVVPSTGTIGGIDEILKRRVIHDTFAVMDEGGRARGKSEDVVDRFRRKMERSRVANTEAVDYVSSGKSGPGTGGFECVIPCLKNSSKVERGVKEMLKHFHKIHNNEDDMKLMRHFDTACDDDEVDCSGGGNNGDAITDHDVEIKLSSTAANIVNDCLSCNDASNSFCAVPTSADDSNLSFLYRCAPDFIPCDHALHEFYEATRIDKNQCHLLSTDHVDSDTATAIFLSNVLAVSNLAYNSTPSVHAGFNHWCERLLTNNKLKLSFTDLRKFEPLRGLCNEVSGDFGGQHIKRRVGNIISGQSSLLREFVDRNYPCKITKGELGRRISGMDLDWTPEGLNGEFKNTTVNVLIFDADVNKTAAEKTILESRVSFGEFGKMSVGGFESVEKGDSRLLAMKQPQLYLLLTTRDLVNKTAVNPNPNSPLLKLLQDADEEFDMELDGLQTAWTNLRLGAGYDYPTHIDCYENIVTQFSGVKRFELNEPDTINAWKPNLSHKHWPGTTEGERNANYRHLLREGGLIDVFLEEGESLYIPLMWFHSVHVDKNDERNILNRHWSVTGNRYFYHGQDEKSWRRVIEEKKGYDFKNYEVAYNQQIC